jgi:hypothetical protein
MSEDTNNTEKLTIQKEKLTGVMSAKQVADTITDAIEKSNEKQAEVIADALKQVAKTLKEPTDVEAKKLAQETFLKKRQLEMKKQEAQELESARLTRETTCGANGHKMNAPGGGYRHAFRATLNSDGAFRPQCIRCWKQFPPIKASERMVTEGMSINDYLISITDLNEKLLIESSHKTYPQWWELQEKKEAERAEFRKHFSFEEQTV